MSQKKRFFTNHAKSSAAFVSIIIHAILIVVAISFVAVTVIKKEENKFENKPVKRPKMQLKKLQVPVNIKKKKQPKPKLRKRIVVTPKLNQTMPDIKMPEISGVKGGLGGAGAGGLGGAGGVGFSMPEIEIFGIKSKGEKVFLILDSSHEMMYNEMGGIPAYSIIKNELVSIIEGLSATTIFNVAVFGNGHTYYLAPSMIPATSGNVAKVKAWLAPLNAVKKGMGDRDFGTGTLGPGGVEVDDDLRVGIFKVTTRGPGGFGDAALVSMGQKADTVFLLTNAWRGMGYNPGGETVDDAAWLKTPAGKKWTDAYRKGLKMLDEENKKRASRGEPPRVLQRQAWAINRAYFPNIQGPPRPVWQQFTPEEFIEGFGIMRANSKNSSMGAVPTKSGLTRKKSKSKDRYSFNVVQFIKKGEAASEGDVERFKSLTKKSNGKYKTIAGMDAIKSAASSDAE